MSQFRIYQDYRLDATLVSNAFIDVFMEDANDAQLKIYLYLLRSFCANKSCSISDLADKFNYTEKDVIRALKHWEKKNLLSLEYDEDKTLVGVRMLDICSENRQTTDSETKASASELSAAVTHMGDNVIRLQSAATTKNEKKSAEIVKAEYTADDIAEFKKKASFDELIFICESYLGKTLNMSELKSLIYISDELGFSTELIDYLVEYCVGIDKGNMHYIEKVAVSWHSQGITSPKEAAKAAPKYDKGVYDIMKSLGKTSMPTEQEVDYIMHWRKDFGFDMEIIQEACSRTVLATDGHRFEYADSVLAGWHRANVKHKSDIETIDQNYALRKKNRNQPKQGLQYTNFMRDDSEYTDLERELLSN